MKWEKLKNEVITSDKDFFDVIEMVWNEDFYLILNKSYKENDKLYIPMVMEVNKKEVIIYVVESCIDGEITGYWKVAKAWGNLACDEDFEYDYWRNHYIKAVSHDLFYSDEFFERKAFDKIIDDVKHIYATSNKQNAFYKAKNYLIDVLMYDRAVLKYILLNENSNRLYCYIDDDVEVFDRESIHSIEFMRLKSRKDMQKIDVCSNHYRIIIRNPKYDNDNINECKLLEIKTPAR